jgi:hypothetical protein
LVGDGFGQMLHISSQTPGGFFQPIDQRSYLGPAWVRHQQPCNRKCGFFKLLELAAQLLAVFIKLLQRFIATDKITVRGFTKLHVLDALMRQLLIFMFKYLSGIFFSVDDVLHIGLRCLQLVYMGLKICKAQEHMSDYYKVPAISTRKDSGGIPLFFWRKDLFLRIKSSLFAYISCTSLWY